MEEVTLDIKGQGVLRPTEIISDLRIVAETFYGAMKMVGFWDYQKDMHSVPKWNVDKLAPALPVRK